MPVTRSSSYLLLAALTALILAGCTGVAPGTSPGPGPGPGTIVAPTLVNLADPAPDRVLALQLKISNVQLHQTSGSSLTVLDAASGLNVETSYRQGLPQPINFDLTHVVPGTYDSVIITLASTGNSVTFVDDTGVVRQDTAPTVSGTTVTVNLSPNVTVSNDTPLVLNLVFLPSSVAIDTTTNTATLSPAFSATLATAGSPASGQTEANGLIRAFTGVVTTTPGAGATSFQISSSQLAHPLPINTDTTTAFTGELAAFGDIVGGNVVQVTAETTAGGTLLAREVEGENAGVGLTSGGDFRGVVTAVAYSAVAPFDATNLSFRVQNVSAAAGAVAIGSNVSVDFTAIPAVNFVVDTQDVDVTTTVTGFTPVFDAASISPAQAISSIFATASTSPKTIKLRLQTLTGTIGTVSNGAVASQKIIQFTPPLDSYFVLLTGQTQLTVVQQPSTTVLTGGDPNPGQVRHIRGLLFFDTASGTYFLIADQLAP